MTPEEQGSIEAEDPAAESVVDDAKSEVEAEKSQAPVGGSFLSRGFKVGRIL
jgi:hypothetical protein